MSLAGKGERRASTARMTFSALRLEQPCLPFVAQQPVQIHIIALPVPPHKFPVGAFPPEPQLLIQSDSMFVIAEHGELHAMEIQLVEGESEREVQRLIAVPFTAMSSLADRNGKPADAVRPENRIEFDEADQFLGVEQAYAEEIPVRRLVVAVEPLAQIPL